MIIPHLHFPGCCAQAIAAYERAFQTECATTVTNREYGADDDGIAHAEMRIHGQRIMLNDRFGNKNMSADIATNLVVTFPSASALRDCYEALKDRCTLIDPLQSLPYSELFVQFIDRFGVQWCFMVEAED